MTGSSDQYPIATLHRFLEEAAGEFRRFRFQATVNLIGSIVLLIFLIRFVIFISVTYSPEPLHVTVRGPFILDSVLLLAALVAILWSVDVWRRQRRFIAKWGERFEKLNTLESRLLPEETRSEA